MYVFTFFLLLYLLTVVMGYVHAHGTQNIYIELFMQKNYMKNINDHRKNMM